MSQKHGRHVTSKLHTACMVNYSPVSLPKRRPISQQWKHYTLIIQRKCLNNVSNNKNEAKDQFAKISSIIFQNTSCTRISFRPKTLNGPCLIIITVVGIWLDPPFGKDPTLYSLDLLIFT